MRTLDAVLKDLADRPPDPAERAAVDRCEALRAGLLVDQTEIGDVFERDGQGIRTTVAQESASASVPSGKALLIHRLVKAARPALVVEFGAALGVSGAYIASALEAAGAGRLVSIEGSPSRAQVAARTIAAASPRAEVVTGYFDEHLDRLDGAGVLFVDGNHQPEPTRRYVDEAAARGARPLLLILDDIIGWSPEMDRVWRDLRRDARFSAAGESEAMGVLVAGTIPGLEGDEPGLLRRLLRR